MTPQTRIAFLGRAARYSPNAVGKDTAILTAVRQRLQEMGFRCADIVWEDRPADMEEADAYVSMGRKQDTLNWLGDFERLQVPVVNCTASVMICNHRTLLMQVLEDSGVPVPPLIGGDGYWVKRGYGCRETDADVQYAPDRATADRLADQLLERGAVDVDIRAHVVGDWLKFYAVRGTDFFHYYFPQGEPHQTPDVEALRSMTAEAADLVHLDVYGGDCIIRPDGQPVLVDLNDWPSFSPCRDEAAVAIAERVRQQIGTRAYLFDYGGTLDTGGCHWGRAIWHAYEAEHVPVSEQMFREAYVYAERMMARQPIVQPDFTFRQTLAAKLRLQMEWLDCMEYRAAVLDRLYAQTQRHTAHSRDVLQRLAAKVPLVLVSNFYGNLHTVLREFGLDGLFQHVVESAVVGVRKPDPRIFQLGVDALGLSPEQVTVVGDSIGKDILPARQLGCRTVWLRGEGWTDDPVDETVPDRIITDLSEI